MVSLVDVIGTYRHDINCQKTCSVFLLGTYLNLCVAVGQFLCHNDVPLVYLCVFCLVFTLWHKWLFNWDSASFTGCECIYITCISEPFKEWIKFQIGTNKMTWRKVNLKGKETYLVQESVTVILTQINKQAYKTGYTISFKLQKKFRIFRNYAVLTYFILASIKAAHGFVRFSIAYIVWAFSINKLATL